MKYKYNTVALGGTFDLLHDGHKRFIDFAFSKSKKVVIGISSDNFAKRLVKADVGKLTTRLKDLRQYLFRSGFEAKSEIVMLDDIYGPAAIDDSIEGLIVTRNTHEGGKLINKKRRENGLKPLDLILFADILGNDRKKISSSRIKNGEINRAGQNFGRLFGNRNLYLKSEYRENLSRPLGRLVKIPDINGRDYVLLISVGDETTKKLIEKRLMPHLAIVDLSVERTKKFSSLSDLGFSKNQLFIAVKNSAGTISADLVSAVRAFFKNPQDRLVLIINGEEDLATIPVVLFAPLGSLVLYGQRGEGLVQIEVTEETKERFSKYLRFFKRVT